MYGNNITATADMLQKVPISYLAQAIKTPKPHVEAQIRQLRIARQLDPKTYSQLKRRLPYIVCGIFNPPYRRKDNLAYTEYFIIDIDHIAQKELDIVALRHQLQADDRVLLSFVSPSADRLKIMFRLDDRCFDANLFSIFYRQFATRFSKQYSLDQVIDTATSDVSRACFISADPDLYYNPSATAITLSHYVDTADTVTLFDTVRSQKAEQKAAASAARHAEVQEAQNIDADVLAQIKARLNPNKRYSAPQRDVYIPAMLRDIEAPLSDYLTECQFSVKQIIHIQYGLKIQLCAGAQQAEVNLFHGRRGFSIVVSPRRGTSAELNDLARQLIDQFLFDYQNQ